MLSLLQMTEGVCPRGLLKLYELSDVGLSRSSSCGVVITIKLYELSFVGPHSLLKLYELSGVGPHS